VIGFISNTGNWIITEHKDPNRPRLFFDQRTSTSRGVAGLREMLWQQNLKSF
jgi:hypothetical protein